MAEKTIEDLVSEFSPLLYRVALSVVRQPQEAEDVVQETFLRVLENVAKLPEVREMRAWLIRITWNLAISRRRRVRPEQMDEEFALSLVGHEVPADAAVGLAKELVAVLAQVDKLPKAEREVLLLSAMEELSQAEISEVPGRTESSVRSLIFRARTHLQERMKASGWRKGEGRE